MWGICFSLFLDLEIIAMYLWISFTVIQWVSGAMQIAHKIKCSRYILIHNYTHIQHTAHNCLFICWWLLNCTLFVKFKTKEVILANRSTKYSEQSELKWNDTQIVEKKMKKMKKACKHTLINEWLFLFTNFDLIDTSIVSLA